MTTTLTDLATGRTFLIEGALPGRDAYEEAVARGFVGDRDAWLASLRGFAFDPVDPDWAPDRTYAANAAVRFDHRLWVAASPSTGVTPGTDPTRWRMLFDGADPAALAAATATATGAAGTASGAAAAAEASRAAAAVILSQTQAAAQALAPIDALHPVTQPVPAGWWDTGDRLLSGTSQRAIISNWQPGILLPAGLWRGTVASSLFSDTAGTTAATLGGQVARVNDGSGNGLNLTQANASLRPLRGRRPRTGVRNLLTNNAMVGAVVGVVGSGGALPTGWSVTAMPAGTVSVVGFGVEDGQDFIDIRLNGTSGTGAVGILPVSSATSIPALAGQSAVGSLSIRRVAGSNTNITHVRSVQEYYTSAGAFITQANGPTYQVSDVYRQEVYAATPANATTAFVRFNCQVATSGAIDITLRLRGLQYEVGAAPTAYQRRAGMFDVTEADVPDVAILGFDHVDDALPSPAIAGGLTGQAFVAGDGGCYVTSLSIAPGGTFQIGGASLHNWTGAPHGALRAVSNNTGRVLDAIIRAGTFTEAEIAALERFYVALGGRALLVPDGPNLWTGTPNRVDPECTVTADDAVSFNTTTTRLVGWTQASPKLDLGAWYLASMNLTRTSGTFVTPYTGSGADLLNTTTAGVNTRIFRASTRELYVGTNGAAVGAMSAISVRRLVNRSL